jgi:hypothetical protein
MWAMFGRSIDRVLRASEERYETFTRELNERRERFDREMERRRDRHEREMEKRYEEQAQLTREFMRRNELVFEEGMRTLAGLVEVTKELRDDIRAQRQGFLALLDRFDNGGEAAAQ